MKCAACESDRITPFHEFASFDNHVRIKDSGSGSGWLGRNDLKIKPARARICLDCGHIMLFANLAETTSLNEAGT